MSSLARPCLPLIFTMRSSSHALAPDVAAKLMASPPRPRLGGHMWAASWNWARTPRTLAITFSSENVADWAGELRSPIAPATRARQGQSEPRGLWPMARVGELQDGPESGLRLSKLLRMAVLSKSIVWQFSNSHKQRPKKTQRNGCAAARTAARPREGCGWAGRWAGRRLPEPRVARSAT
jgi:hypothetical protein